MAVKTTIRDSDTNARLAVIEEKLETVLAELSHIKRYIPVKMVEHSERIEVLRCNMRTTCWLGSILLVALVGAFIGHILKG